MVKLVTKNLFFIVPLAGIFFSYWKIEEKAHRSFTILLHFNTVVGSKPFFLDSGYSDPFGESFTVSKFKYYISNIELKNSVTGVKKFIPNSYYLVNEADSASKNILINIPQNHYDSISFLLGVDSVKNVSGAQSGALDPANDMFWTWNTGYVMAKLEGSSPVSKQIHHVIEYHIGGFKGENSVLQRINLPIPLPEENDKSVREKLKIVIVADINAWFRGSHNLLISQSAVCTSPGQLAKQFSENYRNMFTVRSATSVDFEQ